MADQPIGTPGDIGRNPPGELGRNPPLAGAAESLRREGTSIAEQMSGMRSEVAGKLGELSDDARDAISENPWTASLTVFAVGLVTGAILGALFNRD